jgi:hypothetical protein
MADVQSWPLEYATYALSDQRFARPRWAVVNNDVYVLERSDYLIDRLDLLRTETSDPVRQGR